MSMTANQPSVVDAGAFTVRRTIAIAAPIEKVWAAVTEPEQLSRWFGQRTVLDELAVGAGGTFSFDGYGDVRVRVEELDPLRAVAYRWSNQGAGELDDAHSTVFRFTLEEAGEGTQLTVVESGFGNLADPAGSMEDNRGGWNSELDELVASLESSS